MTSSATVLESLSKNRNGPERTSGRAESQGLANVVKTYLLCVENFADPDDRSTRHKHVACIGSFQCLVLYPRLDLVTRLHKKV